MDLLIVKGEKPIKHDCNEKEEKVDFIASYLTAISERVAKEEETNGEEGRKNEA